AGAAVHDGPRPAVGGAVRAEDEWRPGILRAGDRRGDEGAGLEPVGRPPEGHLHRRERAVHPGTGELPRLVLEGDEPGDLGQYDLLRRRTGGDRDALERRGGP